MPLRYGKTLRGIFREILDLERRGMLTELGHKFYLYENRKSLRELQRLEDKRRWDVLRRATKPISEKKVFEFIAKQKQRRGPTEITKAWANHLAGPDFMAGVREFHPEREVPALTTGQIALYGGLTDAISVGGFSLQAAELQTLLVEHDSDAYKKLVQGAKVGPLFGDEK